MSHIYTFFDHSGQQMQQTLCPVDIAYILCDGYANAGVTCGGVEMTDDIYFDPVFCANGMSPQQSLWHVRTIQLGISSWTHL